MVKKHKISEFRERLDRTLASPGLTNESSIKSLVKNQLLRSPFHGNEGDLVNIVDKHSRNVSNFVEMLRTTPLSNKEGFKTSHTEWKIKQDTEQLRVMYREGPEGSPFHTLLAEGFADGPIDVCLCISWEATLYRTWWPQYNIPAFKIIMSTCLQKVRIGEEISLVRVKVPWPMSVREALLHNFELEYFEEDLLLVLLNTIPEGEHIDLTSHGFTKDGIPEVKDAVRVDLVGGFVLQKISPTRCYFRTIANMDIKLDFVPPSLINFISRQLIGNGYKLYNKAIASVATIDEYQEALKGQMYERAREGVNPFDKSKVIIVGTKDEQKSAAFLKEEDKRSVTFLGEELEGKKSSSHTPTVDNPPASEIEEEGEEKDEEEGLYLEANQITNDTQNTVTSDHKHHNKISPEVENALNILDEAITIFRDLGSPEGNQIKALASHLEWHASGRAEEAAFLNIRDETQRYAAVRPPNEDMASPIVKNSRDGKVERIGRQSSNHDQSMAFSSPMKSIRSDEDSSRTPSIERPADANITRSAPTPSHEGSTDDNITRSQLPTLDHMSKVFDEVRAEVNGTHGSGRYEAVNVKKKKNQRFCCPSFI